MKVTYIPDRTRRELANPSPVGGRHAQMLKTVPVLLGQGLTPQAVFAQLRATYSSDVPDSEINSIISWASKKNFQPCRPQTHCKKSSIITPIKIVPPEERIKAFLRGSCVEGMSFADLELELWDASTWRPLEDWWRDSLMVLAGLFHAGELVNIITNHGVNKDGKAYPVGFGLTLERDAMMRYSRDHGTPQSKAGSWFRSNPVDGKQLPDAKGWEDENITAFRFALLESDKVPVNLQLSLFARLPLPINAIVLTGGKSAHATVRVNARNAESYREKVSVLLELLKPFGIDQSNKNPSRLSRLPGAQREIGAQGDGQQRLLYFAPDRVDCKPILGGNL